MNMQIYWSATMLRRLEQALQQLKERPGLEFTLKRSDCKGWRDKLCYEEKVVGWVEEVHSIDQQ